MPLDHNRPLIYAHRGSSIQAPENTLAAFNLALEQGADGIELDAKLSADGEVVVIHDQTVNRTTNGRGRVNHLTLTQLRSLDAGSWMSPSFAGEKIPTLAEVFDSVGGKMVIMIELTNYLLLNDGLPEKVVELVLKHRLENSVMLTSFYPPNLSAVKAAWPEAPVGILGLRGLPGWIQRSFWKRMFSAEDILPDYRDISAEYVAGMKTEDRRVIAWVVNTPAAMTTMIAYGVAGIITDDPQLGLRTLGDA